MSQLLTPLIVTIAVGHVQQFQPNKTSQLCIFRVGLPDADMSGMQLSSLPRDDPKYCWMMGEPVNVTMMQNILVLNWRHMAKIRLG